MRRLRLVVLCSLALAALGAVGSASAAAFAPTWFACAKAEHAGSGDYTGKTCLQSTKVPTGGKYELREGVGKGKGFKGKGGSATLTAKSVMGSESVQCASSTSAGSVALPGRETGISITFKNCKGPAGEGCTSAGLHAGEIRIAGLAGVLGYAQESPPIISLKLESEAHPGPEGLLVAFSCEGLEATIRGSLSGVQSGDVDLVTKAFDVAFSGSLSTEITDKGEALMVRTEPVEEGGGGGTGVLIGESEALPTGGDSTSGEVTPVLYTAKAKGTIEELKFETAYKPEGGWCSTLEVGVVEARAEALAPFLFGSKGKKTTFPYTPGTLLESHRVSCGTTEGAVLSIPGFHVPIEAGVHYFLTFLPLGPSGNHFNGSRISYLYAKKEAVLFVGEYSGGKEIASNAQKKNAIEEAPGLPGYEWWLESKEAPISIWAVGAKT